MLGNKSGVIFVKDTNPNINTIITETKTVKGFLTLNFGSKYFTSFLIIKPTSRSDMFNCSHVVC
ncbi:hypothetical protein SDC9_103667 [bioreactor metagenome]|uniref:Uncharacterized protein n=1 Tax=bioreactor metagenome TaxID=1076179 RepID=A0A645AX21_9ZZZZ